MNIQSNAIPESSLEREIGSAAMRQTRPMYWSVRRELWENRSIYIAPLAVAGVMLLGSLVSAVYFGGRIDDIMRPVLALEPAKQAAALAKPYDVAAMLLILTSFLVAVFYCLDALHGERRDRSILFWKSLPVSDLTTVLSKAAIPLVVLPLVVFAIIIATQFIMLLIATAALLAHGVDVGVLWTRLPLLEMSVVLLYGIAVNALWYAPIYGWLLLVSGWARRATFLWAVLPPLAICVVEAIGFRTSHFASLLKFRLTGAFTEAFAAKSHEGAALAHLDQLDLAKLLTGPGLWTGLLVAAAFFAAAVWLRRYREPI